MAKRTEKEDRAARLAAEASQVCRRAVLEVSAPRLILLLLLLLLGLCPSRCTASAR